MRNSVHVQLRWRWPLRHKPESVSGLSPGITERTRRSAGRKGGRGAHAITTWEYSSTLKDARCGGCSLCVTRSAPANLQLKLIPSDSIPHKLWQQQEAARTGGQCSDPSQLRRSRSPSYSLTVFSPSGKLVQIEHALAAVSQGTTSLGIKGE